MNSTQQLEAELRQVVADGFLPDEAGMRLVRHVNHAHTLSRLDLSCYKHFALIVQLKALAQDFLLEQTSFYERKVDRF